MIGLVLYRRDKRYRYSLINRMLAIVALLAASWLYITFGTAFQDAEIISVVTDNASPLFLLAIWVAILRFAAIIFRPVPNVGSASPPA